MPNNDTIRAMYEFAQKMGISIYTVQAMLEIATQHAEDPRHVRDYGRRAVKEIQSVYRHINN